MKKKYDGQQGLAQRVQIRLYRHHILYAATHNGGNISDLCQKMIDQAIENTNDPVKLPDYETVMHTADPMTLAYYGMQIWAYLFVKGHKEGDSTPTKMLVHIGEELSFSPTLRNIGKFLIDKEF